MAIDLKDQVIIITGASAGIGAALAIQAAAAGMKVVLAARREEKLQQVADRINQQGGTSLIVPTDVARDDDVARLVERAVETFGSLDVMCANAGYGIRGPVTELDDTAHRQLFETNYFGTVRCIQQAARVMKQQGSGHIMIVSSIVARIGLPLHAAYSATKAAQAALAMGLRVELEKFKIHVTTVHPIGTRTEFFDVSAAQSGAKTTQQNTPDLFMQTPQHVAKKMMAGLRKPRPEIWPGRGMGIASALGLMMPRLTRRSLRNHVKDEQKRGMRG